MRKAWEYSLSAMPEWRAQRKCPAALAMSGGTKPPSVLADAEHPRSRTLCFRVCFDIVSCAPGSFDAYSIANYGLRSQASRRVVQPAFRDNQNYWPETAMTWHAQDGDLVLQGAEARIFRDAIGYLCDEILESVDDEASAYGGASVFDHMTRTQQIASLELVTKHLFQETQDCLELNAWSESTLAGILSEISTYLQTEIYSGESDRVRRLISELSECDVDEDDWDDRSEWESVFEAYEDRFLWDNDFEDVEIADMPPDGAGSVRLIMGITDDYYSSVPPDLKDDRDIVAAVERISGYMG